jgi:hypothetical protein
MAFVIEHFGSGILGTIFSDGTLAMQERSRALDSLERAIAASKPKGLLVDLSQAALGHYGASDALALANRINAKERPFRKVAYVMQPYQTDMVATIMSGLHGPHTFRRFEERESALAWLKQPAPS